MIVQRQQNACSPSLKPHECDADGFFVECAKTPRGRSPNYIPWPKCGKPIDVNKKICNIRPRGENQTRGDAFGTSLNKPMLLKCIAIRDIIIDTLHAVLRVTPKLWEVAVANR